MKFRLTFYLMFCTFPSFGQLTNIYNDWIKTKITYNDGGELPDENTLKYSYFKYSFVQPDKVFFGAIYNGRGAKANFEVRDDILMVRDVYGNVINSFKILKLDDKEMILVQKDLKGYDNADCLKYYFVPQNIYQEKIPFAAGDILKVNGGDTTYKSSRKIYAVYNDDDDFQKLLTDKTEGLRNGRSSSGNHFFATFIVKKDGVADSLKIVESINPKYDEVVKKLFIKTMNNWLPATYHGKKVDVQMFVEVKYFSSAIGLQLFQLTQEANAAFYKLDYIDALTYFNLALELNIDDGTTLYKRAICKIRLGNKEGACEDLQRIKSLNLVTADELIAKYCN